VSHTLIDIESPEAAIHRHANDVNMAKTLSEKLQEAYPGHLWGVNVEGRTGLITIRNLYLSGQWGYVLKIGDVYSISSLECDAVRAGGEILERFRLSRAQFKVEQYAEKPIDFSGRLLFDKS
jgi:hypothetical protein